jgi:hypothetical protein
MENDELILLPPEYTGNVFAEAVGPLRSLAQRYREMAVLPAFSKFERQQHSAFRRVCCLRLLDAFFPHTRQVMLAERVHMLLLDGYQARDPRKGLYQAFLSESVERLETEDRDYVSERGLERVASSSVLLGAPGLGKSRSVRRALAGLGQVSGHVIMSGFITQVPALLVECPAGRGVKQLCKNIFTRLDELLGTSYMKRFGREKIPVETMLLHVQHLCQLHAVGVLVIDEIQNLLDANVGDKKELMKFIVLLINTVGIPVLLVGTCEAAEIFHAGLHAARRGDAIGSDVWDPLPNDQAWGKWLNKLWRYQWTDVDTPLSDELANAIYDQCQGIPDLAVKLYMLIQLELIAAAEASPRTITETITVELIQSVAQNRFKMAMPMLTAIRTNDMETLNKFRDISGFRASMDSIFADVAGMRTEEYERMRRNEELEAQFSDEHKSFPEVRASLASLGLKRPVIDRIMVEAENEAPTGDMFAIVDVARKLASEELKKREVATKQQPRPQRQSVQIDDPNDVRNLVTTQKADNVAK